MNEFKIEMEEQEYNDCHYEFFGLTTVYTRAFVDTFGKDAPRIALTALYMIAEKYPDKNWDYLQVFTFNQINFWIMTNVKQNDSDEVKKNGVVTILLPSDY